MTAIILHYKRSPVRKTRIKIAQSLSWKNRISYRFRLLNSFKISCIILSKLSIFLTKNTY